MTGKSGVVYYPFGLTFNSYSRENATPNKWKFQSQEHVDDLGLNWDSFKWRNHQPDIGRFFNVDPLAEKYVYNSPYAFSENRVVNAVELEGLEALIIHGNRGLIQERKSVATGQQVTTATQTAVLTHPFAASGTGEYHFGSTNIATVSTRISRHLSEDGNMSRGDGSADNAVRHTLLSATITNQYGEDAAHDITNAHEGIATGENESIDFSKPLVQNAGLADGVVDILNNAIGRDIGKSLGENASPKDIATGVLNVQRSAGLWQVKKDAKGNISISRSTISQKQYDNAIKKLGTLDNNGFNDADRKKIKEKK